MIIVLALWALFTAIRRPFWMLVENYIVAFGIIVLAILTFRVSDEDSDYITVAYFCAGACSFAALLRVAIAFFLLFRNDPTQRQWIRLRETYAREVAAREEEARRRHNIRPALGYRFRTHWDHRQSSGAGGGVSGTTVDAQGRLVAGEETGGLADPLLAAMPDVHAFISPILGGDPSAGFGSHKKKKNKKSEKSSKKGGGHPNDEDNSDDDFGGGIEAATTQAFAPDPETMRWFASRRPKPLKMRTGSEAFDTLPPNNDSTSYSAAASGAGDDFYVEMKTIGGSTSPSSTAPKQKQQRSRGSAVAALRRKLPQALGGGGSNGGGCGSLSVSLDGMGGSSAAAYDVALGEANLEDVFDPYADLNFFLDPDPMNTAPILPMAGDGGVGGSSRYGYDLDRDNGQGDASADVEMTAFPSSTAAANNSKRGGGGGKRGPAAHNNNNNNGCLHVTDFSEMDTRAIVGAAANAQWLARNTKANNDPTRNVTAFRIRPPHPDLSPPNRKKKNKEEKEGVSIQRRGHSNNDYEDDGLPPLPDLSPVRVIDDSTAGADGDPHLGGTFSLAMRSSPPPLPAFAPRGVELGEGKSQNENGGELLNYYGGDYSDYNNGEEGDDSNEFAGAYGDRNDGDDDGDGGPISSLGPLAAAETIDDDIYFKRSRVLVEDVAATARLNQTATTTATATTASSNLYGVVHQPAKVVIKAYRPIAIDGSAISNKRSVGWRGAAAEAQSPIYLRDANDNSKGVLIAAPAPAPSSTATSKKGGRKVAEERGNAPLLATTPLRGVGGGAHITNHRDDGGECSPIGADDEEDDLAAIEARVDVCPQTGEIIELPPHERTTPRHMPPPKSKRSRSRSRRRNDEDHENKNDDANGAVKRGNSSPVVGAAISSFAAAHAAPAAHDPYAADPTMVDLVASAAAAEEARRTALIHDTITSLKTHLIAKTRRDALNARRRRRSLERREVVGMKKNNRNGEDDDEDGVEIRDEFESGVGADDDVDADLLILSGSNSGFIGDGDGDAGNAVAATKTKMNDAGEDQANAFDPSSPSTQQDDTVVALMGRLATLQAEKASRGAVLGGIKKAQQMAAAAAQRPKKHSGESPPAVSLDPPPPLFPSSSSKASSAQTLTLDSLNPSSAAASRHLKALATDFGIDLSAEIEAMDAAEERRLHEQLDAARKAFAAESAAAATASSLKATMGSDGTILSSEKRPSAAAVRLTKPALLQRAEAEERRIAEEARRRSEVEAETASFPRGSSRRGGGGFRFPYYAAANTGDATVDSQIDRGVDAVRKVGSVLHYISKRPT